MSASRPIRRSRPNRSTCSPHSARRAPGSRPNCSPSAPTRSIASSPPTRRSRPSSIIISPTSCGRRRTRSRPRAKPCWPAPPRRSPRPARSRSSCARPTCPGRPSPSRPAGRRRWTARAIRSTATRPIAPTARRCSTPSSRPSASSATASARPTRHKSRATSSPPRRANIRPHWQPRSPAPMCPRPCIARWLPRPTRACRCCTAISSSAARCSVCRTWLITTFIRRSCSWAAPSRWRRCAAWRSPRQSRSAPIMAIASPRRRPASGWTRARAGQAPRRLYAAGRLL